MNRYYCDPCASYLDIPKPGYLVMGRCERCAYIGLSHEYKEETLETDKLPENIPDSRFDASFDAIFGKR